MNLSIFSLKVDFALTGTPKVFRELGSCATRPSAYQPGPGFKHARCPNASAFGFPRSLKLLWLKSTFARNIARFIYELVDYF
jgi:hypothetical protein